MRSAFLTPIFFVSAAACVAQLPAAKVVTVRMLDAKTGHLLDGDNYLARINHDSDAHGEWIHKNEDGTVTITLPAYAKELSVHSTYDQTMSTYVNCDSDKEHASSEHSTALDRWYSVADILSAGIVAPNNCAGKKIPEKLQVGAKPGEFVFFVRPMNARERMKE